jgi:hypothetical protein
MNVLDLTSALAVEFLGSRDREGVEPDTFFQQPARLFRIGSSQQREEEMSLTAFRLGVIKSVVIACVVVASPSFAQEFRATITGQVSDSSGSFVPAATVTAVQQGTNQAYTAKSNAAGVFSVEYVNPGQYKVTVEATGFSAQVYPNVTLDAGQTLNLNVTLKVGSIHEQVTVGASPGLLDTASAASGGAIDQTKVETLPTDNGEFAQGVRSTGYGDIVSYVFSPSGVGGNISFNGSPTGQSTYYLNGAPVSPQGTVQFTKQTLSKRWKRSATVALNMVPAPAARSPRSLNRGPTNFTGARSTI